MIVPGPATRVFLAPGATDLRRSFDGLHGLVRSQSASAMRPVRSAKLPSPNAAG